jgi:hypothetical protein
MKQYVRMRIYMKPLFAGNVAVDVTKVMERGKAALLRRLRDRLRQQVFSPAAKAALSRAMSIKIKPSSLQLVARHPGFMPLLGGQKREQMTWLTKARAPIPIVLDSGKIIFRSATPLSMQNGRWWHPGRRPTNYLQKAREETRQYLRATMTKEIMKSIKLQMARATMKLARGTR